MSDGKHTNYQGLCRQGMLQLAAGIHLHYSGTHSSELPE